MGCWMSKWDVHFHQKLEKEIRRLPKQYIQNIFEAIENLAINPHPPQSNKVQGHELWRIRVGVYRILYEIDEENHIVRTYRIGHRKNVYLNI